MKSRFYGFCVFVCVVLAGFKAGAQSLMYNTQPLYSQKPAGLSFSFNDSRYSSGLLALSSRMASNGVWLEEVAKEPPFGVKDCDAEEARLLHPSLVLDNINSELSAEEYERRSRNRRLVYSGLWAYASLNYIYADLVQFMDKEEHVKYHTGNVNGFEITPGFIAGSAAVMQIALANVFLPHVIKNDRTLRWVQIASGTVMTLIQSATLFAGKPTPYYAVFSGVEIAATSYITIDAFRWKAKKNPGRY